MKKWKTFWRRSWRWLLGLIVVFLLAAVSLPLWFQWVARPALAHFGLHFSQYSREGLGRLRLTDVKGEWHKTQFDAERVECLMPVPWLWTKWVDGGNNNPVLVVSNGLLTVHAATNLDQSAASKTNSTFDTLERIERIGAALQNYLPSARFTNCAIVIHSNRLSLPVADWHGGGLHAEVRPWFEPGQVDLEVRMEGKSALSVTASSSEQQASLKSQFMRERGNWVLSGEATWLTNRAELSAGFSKSGWWPERAELTARDLHIPGGLVRLKGYEDLTVSLAIDLATNQFTLQATGYARPVASAGERLPPLQADVRAHGDPDSIIVDQLQVNAPWLKTELTDALGIRRNGELIGNSAQLHVTADLSQLPASPLTGLVNGEVNVDFHQNESASAFFDLACTNLAGWGINTRTVALRGKFKRPILTVDEFKADFEDGSKVRSGGAFDVDSRTINGANWSAAGPFLNRFLHGVSYSTLNASGSASGPLTNVTHSGKIMVGTLLASSMNPMEASAEWEAQGLDFSSVSLELAASNSVLALAGKLNLNAITSHAVGGTLQSASLQRHGDTLYSLQQPCPLHFSRENHAAAASGWRLLVDDFNWRGSDRNVSLKTDIHWPAYGSVHSTISDLNLGVFDDFLESSITNVAITKLVADAGWSNGPVQLSLAGNATLTDLNGRKYKAQARLEGGDELKIQELALDTEYAPALVIRGVLPVKFVPSRGSEWIVTDSQRQMALQAELQPGAEELPIPLGSVGRLQLSRPKVEARASGTLDAPVVNVSVNVASLKLLKSSAMVRNPQLDDFKLEASVTPDLLDLREFAARLEDQPFDAAGKWPLPPGFWKTSWKEMTLPDWRLATGHLRIDGAEVAALSRHLPKILVPEGRLKLDLSLAEGGSLHGSMTFTNAATRQFGSLPPIRGMAARLRFDGDSAILDDFHGEIGGQPVKADGRIGIPTSGPLEYQVHLQGSNVPLTRSIEFLLRGDVDLNLQGGGDSPSILSGDVKLRHGLYLRYTSDFLWSSPKRPAVHPPYFSITNEPFADWNLNVKVNGERFLRVRMPVFTGTVSAGATVRGTAREPVITGDARINSGRITFPFGTLNVDEGYASLAGNDPRGPDLQIHASGQSLDYNINLNISGHVDEANIEFSSTPPLSSQEILLMLTVGEVPERQSSVSTGAKAGRLASFLGKDFVSRVTGSDAAEDRLIVNTGQGLTEEGRLTYSVEYLINKRWSIIGDHDRFNDYNANLKWTILSR